MRWQADDNLYCPNCGRSVPAAPQVSDTGSCPNCGDPNVLQVEGIPIGTKLVRIGAVNPSEFYIDLVTGKPMQWRSPLPSQVMYYSIIAPDNVYGVIDLAASITSRFNGIGSLSFKCAKSNWFRCPQIGEAYLAPNFTLHRGGIDLTGDTRRIIMEPTHVSPKPKMRRVLVAEYLIDETLDGTKENLRYPDNVTTPQNAESCVKNFPTAYRIEEREESK
jgi:hypothetical protein